MFKHQKKIVVGALVSALLLSGCTSGGGTDDGTGGNPDGPAFIYVTNTPIGINKFLDLGKMGVEAAAKEFKGSSKVYESTDDQSRRSNVEAAIAEAPAAIVLITFDFTDMSKEYAEANPDQEFVLIDACPEAPPANLHCAVFREQEASYLVGIEAGMLSKSGKIGSVMAVDIPFLHKYSDSFAAGAKSVNPNINDRQLAIGGNNPFADPAKGKEQALSLFATGADHVFAIASGSNGGIFEAASEAKAFGYGVDINQCPMAPGAVVDNTMKAVDVLVVSEIGKILDGTAESVSSYGLKEAGMDLTSLMADAASSQCVVMEHPDVIEAVKKAKQGIIDGTIVVKDPTA
ncbi:MAG: BMP family ABC transporter substrate-binding protein [Microbacteriaceae bacterium]